EGAAGVPGMLGSRAHPARVAAARRGRGLGIVAPEEGGAGSRRVFHVSGCWRAWVSGGDGFGDSGAVPGPVPAPALPRCGYDMHGLPSDTCPECGGPVDLETIGRMRDRGGGRWRRVSLVGGG